MPICERKSLLNVTVTTPKNLCSVKGSLMKIEDPCNFVHVVGSSFLSVFPKFTSIQRECHRVCKLFLSRHDAGLAETFFVSLSHIGL